ncbi:MAG: glycosyltransferase [Cytophagaceae bacterium]
MSFIEVALYVYFFILFLGILANIIIWLIQKERTSAKIEKYPLVSVLIAARNEEGNILSCLKALEKINYPSHRFEVLVGDDHSEDDTFIIASNFTKDKPGFSVHKIQSTVGKAKGKANVLAQLAHKAKGELLFITDADIEVPENWILGLLKHYEEGCGIVSGSTMVKGTTWFDHYQTVDWLYAFGMVQNAEYLKLPVSAVGNNMFIVREAYDSVGGYENIPFSIIEDLELFKFVCRKGWDYKNIFNQETLAFSKPAEGFLKLMHQRKRWMRGALTLSPSLVFTLFFQSIFLPLWLVLLFISPVLALGLWGLKFLLQMLLIGLILKKVGQQKYLRYIPIHELYSGVLNAVLLIFYCLPMKINWKGRKY